MIGSQPRNAGARIAMSMSAAVLLAFTWLVGFSPPPLASGHGLGDDGRIPGQSDFKRVGGATYEYLPGKEEYRIRRPGEPPAFTHWDPSSAELALVEGDENASAAHVKLSTAELAPVCRTGGNRIVILYEGPAPVPTEALRSIVRRMNWKIADQSSQSSGGSRIVRMAVDCDFSGNISIYNSEASKEPFGRPTGADAVKYLVLDPGNGGGSAALYNDETKGRTNLNATQTALGGASSWETYIPMHELLHTLGGVQLNAPFANGGIYPFHCTDNADVLCYPSSTWPCPEAQGYMEPIKVPIDCNKDTYFNAAPRAGSYLATHWNIAGPEDPFLTVVVNKAPKATTKAPTSVASGSAVLAGTVTPESEYAMYQFQYGETASYGSITAKHGVLGRYAEQANVSLLTSSLVPNTTYHYRIVASNDAGELAYGADQTFTTSPQPAVVSEPVEGINVSDSEKGSATLRATINGGKTDTTYQFRWGATTSYGSVLPASPESVGAAGVYTTVTQRISGLKGNTIYHYCVGVTNKYGTACNDNTFTTPNWNPEALTVSAALNEGNATVATLSGSVYPIHLDALGNSATEGFLTPSYRFGYQSVEVNELGESKVRGWIPASLTPVENPVRNGNKVTALITELEPGKAYRYHLEASNIEGSADGGTVEFTTPAAVLSAESKGVTGFAADGQLVTLNGSINTNLPNTNKSYWFEYGPTASYGTKTIEASAGSGTGTVAVSKAITGLSANSTYHFRIVATNSNGTSYGEDVSFRTPPPYDFAIGSSGSAGGQLRHPTDEVVDPAGNVWVTDTWNNRISEFNSKGEFIKTFGKDVNKTKVEQGGTEAVKNLCTAASGNTCQAGTSGSADGQLAEPLGIAMTSGGNLWVTEKLNERVQEFNTNGVYLNKFNKASSGGRWAEPTGIAIGSENHIWVAQARYGSVEEFTETGTVIREVWGLERYGSGNGEFFHPTAVATDSKGDVWVADSRNNRVQELGPNGEYIAKFSVEGEPNGIAVGSFGNILVATGVAREYTTSGQLFTMFGQSTLSFPQGIAIGPGGVIYVANTNSSKVEKWG
jgi:hypothetical protein